MHILAGGGLNIECSDTHLQDGPYWTIIQWSTVNVKCAKVKMSYSDAAYASLADGNSQHWRCNRIKRDVSHIFTKFNDTWMNLSSWPCSWQLFQAGYGTGTRCACISNAPEAATELMQHSVTRVSSNDLTGIRAESSCRSASSSPHRQ